jgi:hypothetical protein
MYVKSETQNFVRFTSPKRISYIDMRKLLRQLNSRQRAIVMHVIQWLKIKSEALKFFLVDLLA